MWGIIDVIWGTYLGILALQDVKTQKVSLIGLAAGILLFIASQQVITTTYLQRLGGIGLGIVLLVIGKLTQESIGYGDGLICMFLGGIIGIWKLFICVICGFFLCAIYGIVMIAIKKCRKEDGIPFLPFLFVGYLLAIW